MELKHLLSSRIITVEPLLFFLIVIQGVLFNLRTQYLELRIAKNYNYTLPNIGSADSSCWINETKHTIRETIEAETATWILYQKDALFFVPLFAATILPAASDYIGRRPIFIINSLCHLIKSCIFLLVSIFELPLWLLICAQAINGLGGSIAAAQATALAYLADIYPEDQRAFRFVIVSLVIYAGFGVSQLAIGQILQVTHDFRLSFSCAVVLGVINMVYVCSPYFIPESLANTKDLPKDLMKHLYLSYIRLFQKDATGGKFKKKRPVVLAVTLLAKAFYSLIHEGIYAVITIYGIAAPFCWTPFETGIYAIMANTFPALCSLAAVRVLSLCLNNFWMLHISYISAVSQQLVVAWAMSSVVILYASNVAGFLRTVASAIYNAQLSKLVRPDEQGVLFGCSAIVNTIGALCSPLVFNTSYAAFSKQGKPRNTFFLSAGLLGIPMILNGILHFESIVDKTAVKTKDDDTMYLLDNASKSVSE